MYKYETKQLENAAAVVVAWDKRIQQEALAHKAAYAAYRAQHEAIWAAVPIAAHVEQHDVVSKKDYILALIVLPLILTAYFFIGV